MPGGKGGDEPKVRYAKVRQDGAKTRPSQKTVAIKPDSKLGLLAEAWHASSDIARVFHRPPFAWQCYVLRDMCLKHRIKANWVQTLEKHAKCYLLVVYPKTQSV